MPKFREVCQAARGVGRGPSSDAEILKILLRECVTGTRPDPCGVLPPDGTRHMTVGCEGGCAAVSVLLQVPVDTLLTHYCHHTNTTTTRMRVGNHTRYVVCEVLWVQMVQRVFLSEALVQHVLRVGVRVGVRDLRVREEVGPVRGRLDLRHVRRLELAQRQLAPVQLGEPRVLCDPTPAARAREEAPGEQGARAWR